jgi:hypothetical protein
MRLELGPLPVLRQCATKSRSTGWRGSEGTGDSPLGQASVLGQLWGQQANFGLRMFRKINLYCCSVIPR